MGNTALHIAALHSNLEIAKILVNTKKINFLMKNFEDFTVFDSAEQMGHQQVAEYLELHVLTAQIWKRRNCMVKLWLHRKRTNTRWARIPNGVFREIVKYA